MRGDFSIEPLGVTCSNLITSAGLASLLQAVARNQPPGWQYIAVGVGSSPPGSAQTALDCEIHREPVCGGLVLEDYAKLTSIFGPFVGNGHWREVAVFDSDIHRLALSTCETVQGWSSDGTLVVSTSVVQQGGAALRCQAGPTTVTPFTSGSIAPEEALVPFSNRETPLADAYFQFWYRTSAQVGTVSVSYGSGPDDCFTWDFIVPSTDEWHVFTVNLGTSSYLGDPWTSRGWTYFKLKHKPLGQFFDEYLDYLSLFIPTGVMLCRGTLDVNKVWNTAVNVFYRLRFG